MTKLPSMYLTDKSLQLLATPSDSLSGAINRTIDRYHQILKHIELPPFTAAEIATLLSATQGVLYEPAEMIAGLWDLENELVDDLTGKIDPTDAALVEKLKALSFPQEVALLEHLEQRRKADTLIA